MGTVKGRVHSFETGGMVDGPGIRFVIFLQGCPLRCLYCHNPDSWDPRQGQEYTADDLIGRALKYKNYMGASGGITISGGEPLLQPDFVHEILVKAAEAGIHTALDTSGFAPRWVRESILPEADLVLLDIKSMNPAVFERIAGVSMDSTLASLDELRRRNVPVWIRHVVVPGLSDDPADAVLLADSLRGYPNIEKIEILPFHKMGEYKWAELNKTYELGETDPPSEELMAEIRQIFLDRELRVH